LEAYLADERVTAPALRAMANMELSETHFVRGDVDKARVALSNCRTAWPAGVGRSRVLFLDVMLSMEEPDREKARCLAEEFLRDFPNAQKRYRDEVERALNAR
jgi:hypothetical protein